MKPIQVYEGEGKPDKLTNSRKAGKRGRVIIYGLSVTYRFGITAPHAGNRAYLDSTIRKPGVRYWWAGIGVTCPGKKKPKADECLLTIPPNRFMTADKCSFIPNLTRADIITMLTPGIEWTIKVSGISRS